MVEEMMTTLRIITNEEDKEKFLKLQEGFIMKYQALPQCKTFIDDYFIKYYRSRSEKWAMCYRKTMHHANINTTGHIESFHHRLKRVYLKRKVNRRLDDLVNILLELEWDDYLTRIREAAMGFAFQPQDILSRHVRAMEIEDDDIKQVDENTWDIKASTAGKVKYQLVRYHESCRSDHCFSKCGQISCSGLCAHMYSCSCWDNHPMCKHIHKLHSILNRDIAKQMRDNECESHVVSNDSQDTTHEACQDSSSGVVDTTCFNMTSSRVVSRQRQELEESITYLSEILSSGKPEAISHAATVLNDLVLQLKYMKEDDDGSTQQQRI
jgi:hypothetical protein